ncbi:Uncharacterised protein [Pantoea agglomerans]|uniref:6-phosphofructokinase n=1 Tax=Enterobacter agglomerans TaxID=549 RepID=A0A379AH35_ENTAG|nr:Uncharacterised protein [Pantoea agglomerans]
MRIGMVISGGDVTGINNFVFQLGRLTQAEIVIFDGGIPGLLANNHRDISQRDLLDFAHRPDSGYAIGTHAKETGAQRI